jgi:hypothetical protein
MFLLEHRHLLGFQFEFLSTQYFLPYQITLNANASRYQYSFYNSVANASLISSSVEPDPPWKTNLLDCDQY